MKYKHVKRLERELIKEQKRSCALQDALECIIEDTSSNPIDIAHETLQCIAIVDEGKGHFV
tara:strand:- start:130 stop:312 length:183 start_codon:yes stop_codon:yes gene_type:complete